MPRTIPPYSPPKKVKPKRKPLRPNAIATATLIKLLWEGTHTIYELAEQSGLSYITCRRYLGALHRIGAAHICGWELDRMGRDNLRLFKLGPGKDVKRTKRSARVRSADRRTKVSQLTILHALAGTLENRA